MHKDLTQGKIFSTIFRLALPIAGGQVMHMAYNLLDMFWIGLVSGDAITSVGIAGLFMWLSVGLMLIGRVGAEVGVAQARGRGDTVAAYRYSRTTVYIAAVLGTVYGIFLIVFRTPLIGLFNFQAAHIALDAANYTAITAIGMPAMFISSAIGGAFVASGNAKTPLLISAGGLILNMVLTPLLVFGFGLGVVGAAFASIIAQYTVLTTSIFALKRFKSRPFAEYHIFTKDIISDFRDGIARDIFKLTIPICIENTIFPLLSMVTTSFEVGFGDFIPALTRVGTQVESLSWLVGAGFGAALTAFVGQNFGAGEHERISKAVKYTTGFLAGWGLIVTLVMWFGGEIVFGIFLSGYAIYPERFELFLMFMRILAVCQIFANLEFVAGNAFRGKGRPLPPSIVGIASNVIRVPLAFALSRTSLGVLGIWAAISFTAALRGICSCTWYFIDEYKEKRNSTRTKQNPLS